MAGVGAVTWWVNLLAWTAGMGAILLPLFTVVLLADAIEGYAGTKTPFLVCFFGWPVFATAPIALSTGIGPLPRSWGWLVLCGLSLAAYAAVMVLIFAA
jgi:hypothetical protein